MSSGTTLELWTFTPSMKYGLMDLSCSLPTRSSRCGSRKVRATDGFRQASNLPCPRAALLARGTLRRCTFPQTSLMQIEPQSLTERDVHSRVNLSPSVVQRDSTVLLCGNVTSCALNSCVSRRVQSRFTTTCAHITLPIDHYGIIRVSASSHVWVAKSGVATSRYNLSCTPEHTTRRRPHVDIGRRPNLTQGESFLGCQFSRGTSWSGRLSLYCYDYRRIFLPASRLMTHTFILAQLLRPFPMTRQDFLSTRFIHDVLSSGMFTSIFTSPH